MKFFIALLTLAITLPLQANTCQKVKLDENASDYKVFASATKGLHIQFYEDIKFSILSNDTLWKSHANPKMKNHFWLFSQNFSTKDNEVGVTFITKSGQSINLVVQQKTDSPSCLIIDDSGLDHVIAADFTEDDIIATQKPEPLITSSYSFDKSMVRSAHDNSRFTIVELNGFSTGKALYSVVAYSEGKKHVISNPAFDSVTNTYEIPGIHDELLFQNGPASFTVKRL